jgi:hypothetical protein
MQKLILFTEGEQIETAMPTIPIKGDVLEFYDKAGNKQTRDVARVCFALDQENNFTHTELYLK